MAQETHPSVESARFVREAVTLKAILVGIVVVLLSEAYITWGMLHLASRMNKSYLPMGLFFVYVVLVLINIAFDRAKSRWALSQAELQVVLGMGCPKSADSVGCVGGTAFLVGVFDLCYWLADVVYYGDFAEAVG